MSKPLSLDLPPGAGPRTIMTSRGPLATLHARPLPEDQPLHARTAAVLVHGFTGSKEDFLPVLGPLAATGREVLAYDQRGQYESSSPDDPSAYTVPALAEDLLSVIDEVGPPVHLVGHSFGGLVARAAVISRPEIARSFTLLDSGPGGLTGPRRVWLELMAPVIAAEGIDALWAALEAVQAGDPRVQSLPAEVREFLKRRFLSQSPLAVQVSGRALLDEPDRVDELRAAYPGPILVAFGAGDDAWSPADQEQMAARLGVPHVGHPRCAALTGRREPGGHRQGPRGVLGPGGGVTRPDRGLFGPESVTWRVHADPVLWLGGLRALLLQTLHPLAMAGVAQHSAFRADPWGRLLRTAGYIGTVTFGTTADAHAAGAKVRRVHRGLAGLEPTSGQPYTVEDPDLLRWVHCCLVDSFLTTYQRAGGGLTGAEADRYVAEQTRLAPLVGLTPAEVPAATAELAAYFTAVRPELRCTPAAADAARLVVWPPMPLHVQLLTPARPAWSAIGALSVALLPRWARRLYRLPGLPTTDLAATASLRLLAPALHRLPERYREGPHLRAARARLAGASPRHLTAVDG